MTCQGCANAVTRILKKIDGINDIQTDIPKQTVIVQHSDKADPQTMYQALKKWGDAGGKKVELNQ